MTCTLGPRPCPARSLRTLAIAALTIVGTGPVSAQTRIGDYVYEQSTDPASRRDRSQVSTAEVNGRGPDSARLVWRCDGPEMSVFLLADDVPNVEAGIQWRFDDGPSSPYTHWPVSGDTAVFGPEPIVPLFTHRAKEAGRVRVRLWNDRGIPQEYRFSLNGLTEALDRLGCSAPAMNGMTAVDPSKNVLWMYGTADSVEAAAALQWKCEGSEPIMEVIETGTDLTEVIRTDFDGTPSSEDYWHPNTLSGPRGSSLRRFSARVAASDSLRIRFRSAASGYLSARFDTSGFAGAYAALDCGGSLLTESLFVDEAPESRDGAYRVVPSELWNSAIAEVSDPVLIELHDLFYTVTVVRGSTLVEDYAELALLVETVETELAKRGLRFVPIVRPRVVEPTDDDTIYSVGNGVSAPTIISRTEPDYTDEAKAEGVEGAVVLEVVITKDGSVDGVQVLESLDPGLDANAIAAVRLWTFRPALREGEPVNVRAKAEVRFTID